MHVVNRSAAFPVVLFSFALATAFLGVLITNRSNAKFGSLRKSDSVSIARRLVLTTDPECRSFRIEAERATGGSASERRFWSLNVKDEHDAHKAFIVLDAETGNLSMFGSRFGGEGNRSAVLGAPDAVRAGRDWLRALHFVLPEQSWTLSNMPEACRGTWKLAFEGVRLHCAMTLDSGGRVLCISASDRGVHSRI